MRLFRRREKAITGTPAVLEALSNRTFSPYPALGGSNLNVQRIGSAIVEVQNASYGWIYRCSPPVRTVINYIALNAAQLGLKLYERISDDERQHVGDHPAAKLLRNPNPNTPGQQFIYELWVNFLVYDNAYALKVPDANGDVRQMYGLSPSIVGMLGNNYFAAEGYRVWNPYTGESFDVEPERMLHWRGHNPDKPRQGESKLETLREMIASDVAAEQAVTELHRSGLSMSAWLERPLDAPELSDTALQRLREQSSNWAKRGRKEIPVWEEGMSLKTGGVTPEDAEYIATRAFNFEKIAGLYGMKNVPPASDEERRHFYADVLPPLTELCATFLDLHVLQREYGRDDLYFEFGREKIMDEVLKTLTSASGRPVLLTNEARAMIDQPPVDGGDELVTPANVLVGENPLPSPAVMPIQNPNGPPQDGSHRSGAADQPAPAGTRSLRSTNKTVEMSHAGPAQLNGNGHVPELEMGLKANHVQRKTASARRRTRNEADITVAIRDFLSHQERSLKSKKMDEKAVNDERWDGKLTDRLTEVGQRLVAREGGLVAARIGMADIDTDLTENYVKDVSKAKAKQINSALRKRLRDAEDPTEVFKAARENDAPRAATTLAGTLTSFARQEAGRQSGQPERLLKTWLVTSGNSEHPEMDGESVPLNTSFSNGTDGPPADHPGCMCELEIDTPMGLLGSSLNGKALEPTVPEAQPPRPLEPQNIHIHLTMGEMKFELPAIPEGAITNTTNIAPPPPANVHVDRTEVNVLPTEVSFAKGAFENNVTVEAPEPSPPADVTVNAPVTVEPSPPANIEKGAFQVDVAAPNVEVKAAEAPNVHVEMHPGKPQKKTVTFSDGRTAEINESEEDDGRHDQD